MKGSRIFGNLIKIIILFNLFNLIDSADIRVADWDFHNVRDFFVISLFILCLLIVKFVHAKVHWINSFIPESFILLMIGTTFGLIFRFGTNLSINLKMDPNLFFLILLPPIVLNSAYEMTTRSFFRVFGICILYAVLGTIFNFFIIGFTLYGVTTGGIVTYGVPSLSLSLRSVLLFASLIVAVDPVAVLAIFSDIGVERELYFIVFGESLLNDAVTVVLYDIMKAFLGTDPISTLQIGLGIISFFTVSLGGLLIGLVFGIISCFVTRIYDNKFEVPALILLGFLSYILADTISWSGIIAIIGCGILQAEYAFNNISPESLIVLRNVVEMWANLSEGIIFLYLGEGLTHIEKGWHSGFIFWALFLCLVSRSIVCGCLALFNNLINLEDRRISITELIIIIYGGLRGAVAYCLAVLIDPSKMDGSTNQEKEFNRELLISTTLFIILFTITVNGITMKPLVKLLKIKTTKVENLSLFKTMNVYVMDMTLSGIEGITGDLGQNIVREKLIRINNHYIKRVLQKSNKIEDDSIMKVIDKISLAMHYAITKPEESESYLQSIPQRMRHNKSMNFFPFYVNENESQQSESEDLDSDKKGNSKTSLADAIRKTRRDSVLLKDTIPRSSNYYKGMNRIIRIKRKAITAHYKHKTSKPQ